MSPTSLEDLDRRQQQRVVARSAIRILVSAVLLFALYGALPVADRTGLGTLLELFIGLIIFAAVLGWQVLKIMGAEHPELRAAEALAIAVPVVLIVFAFTYLSLSHVQPEELLGAAQPRPGRSISWSRWSAPSGSATSPRKRTRR